MARGEEILAALEETVAESEVGAARPADPNCGKVRRNGTPYEVAADRERPFCTRRAEGFSKHRFHVILGSMRIFLKAIFLTVVAGTPLWAETCADQAQGYIDTAQLFGSSEALDDAANTLADCLTEQHVDISLGSAAYDYALEFSGFPLSLTYSDCSETTDVSLMEAELLELCKRLD